MNNSSNKNMENILALLSKIEKVEPQRDLLSSLLQRRTSQKPIPMRIVGIAAASLFFLISSEIFIIKNINKSQERTALNNYISSPPYNLYNE